ncbi:glycosyltransferase [Candidatus Saccharibacteria bacterium]|nr:glycosyltransferase [Candidatus Saccharibacteria bacterium]
MKGKIKNFGITVVKGAKNAWTKYHFLIPPRLWKNYLRFLWSVIYGKESKDFWSPYDKNGYNLWLDMNEKPTKIEKLKYRPLISVVIPVYNVDGKYLRECIESVLGQSYNNFEICIVDDASSNKETLAVLQEYEKNKKVRVKYRKKNGHISRTSNDAIDMAKGEYVALLDNDDLLVKDALYEVVKVLNKDKKIDFVYTDEDKIDMDGKRCWPNFKPDFSPDTFLSMNYICHLSVIRTSLLRKVGGFTVGLEGAQDFDLFLRVSENTDNIYHIPKILYHWRMIPGSTAVDMGNKDYAADSGWKSVELALKRRGLDGRVEKDAVTQCYQVFYNLKKEPLVSVLIPTKDHAKITEVCLRTLYEKTVYKNFEVILIDNGSTEKESLELFEKYKKEHKNFKVLREDIEFNYAKLNNLAAKEAKGEYLVLLNNDTEIITPEWLNILVGYAALPHVGAVGAKLLYPDNTIQHAGVLLGLGGPNSVAVHALLGAPEGDPGNCARLRVPYNYSAVTGACLCVSKKKYEEVGGLEEDLKVAYNDVDFNLKLLEKGYYNVVVPMAKLYHHESKSRGSDMTKVKYERLMEESDFMWEKWGKVLDNDKFYNKNFSKLLWFALDKAPHEIRSDLEWKKQKKGKTILFVVGDKVSAQYRYRVSNVIETIRKYTNWNAGAVYTGEVNDRILMGVDLVVILRQAVKGETVPNLIKTMHKKGIKVVFDIDDLIFDYKDLTKILKGVHSVAVPYWMGIIWGSRKIATNVDGFITTNDFLAKRLKRSFNKPVKVVPNSLNDAQLEVAEECLKDKKHDGFVIGYFSGSPTHVRDLRLVEPEIFRFLDKHKDAKLKIVGFMEPSLEMKKRIKNGQVEIVKFMDYLNQMRMVSKVDVNIAPLVISEFTNCKSELKFFEAAVVETTTIASPIYTFKKAIKNGENGFLAKPGEWYDKLEYLYDNPKQNQKIAKAARKCAIENYHGEKFAEEVEVAYKAFMV